MVLVFTFRDRMAPRGAKRKLSAGQSFQNLNLPGVVDIVGRDAAYESGVAHLATPRHSGQIGWVHGGYGGTHLPMRFIQESNIIFPRAC